MESIQRRRTGFLIGGLLMIPLLITLPAITLVSKSNYEYAGLIFHCTLGSIAAILLYCAHRTGHKPLSWFQKIKRKDIKFFIYGVGAWAAITAIFYYANNRSSDFVVNVFANIGLLVIAGWGVFLLRTTGSIIGPILIHLGNNSVNPILSWESTSTSIHLTAIAAAFSEELMKISLAIGISIVVLMFPRFVNRKSIVTLLAYVVANGLWIYSHCHAYPLPFLACV